MNNKPGDTTTTCGECGGTGIYRGMNSRQWPCHRCKTTSTPACYYDAKRECREGDCCLPLPDEGATSYPPQQPRWQRDAPTNEGS